MRNKQIFTLFMLLQSSNQNKRKNASVLAFAEKQNILIISPYIFTFLNIFIGKSNTEVRKTLKDFGKLVTSFMLNKEELH